VQLCGPGCALYVPAAHSTHTDNPSLPVDPASHVHAEPDKAPALKVDLPSTHWVQLCGPGCDLYVPALHNTHTDSPSLPVDPASQVHAESEEAPALKVDLPSTHSVQLCGPDCALYLPASHSIHTDSPSLPVDPALHVHVESDKAPALKVDLPSTHWVQLCGPRCDLYVPASHSIHTDSPSLPVDPALHVHVESDKAPVLKLDLPTTHSVQTAEPFCDLYVPSSQSEHTAPPSAPVDPASQMHSASEVAPSVVVDLPLGHQVQCTAPGDAAYLLCVQYSHVAFPGALLCFPGAH